jgi:alpha-glucoside transport system substrate-binding protein
VTAANPAGTPAAGATGSAAPAAKPAAIQKVGGTVNVLATWGGDEQQNFMDMVKPFEDQSGAKIQYEGTRDLNAVLTTRVSGGNPPDVAGLPGPGPMAQFARQGKLIDLNGVFDQAQMKSWYSDDWMKLAQVDGKQTGIFIKSALKGLVWYSPKAFSQGAFQAPKSWDELMQLSQKMASSGTTPWSIGLESGAASGWPGTDWIENILLRQAGAEVYDQWHQGKAKWSSDQVKKAWQTWGQIVGDTKMVFGGKQAILSTNFGDAANPLFANPPKAFLHLQADFMTSFITKANKNLKPGEDFSVFLMPGTDATNVRAEVGGDLFGMFKDTPAARELMKWLVTPDAQQIWVKKGGALSPNKAVPESAYPDPVAKTAAGIATSAKTLRFDGSDLMPDAMNSAFFKACLDFVNNPGNLDSILANLDKVQADAYKS